MIAKFRTLLLPRGPVLPSRWPLGTPRPRYAQAPGARGRAAPGAGPHAGGEANLVLPDLSTQDVPGDQRPHAADGRPGRVRASASRSAW